MRLWMIAYDIADDATRTRVEKYLLRWGNRVQYSVFEAYLSPQQARAIVRDLGPLLDGATDSLRLYPLCRWCEPQLRIHGQGRRSDDPGCIVL